MAQAARVGDPAGHPGTVSGPGVDSVLIGGKPAAVQGGEFYVLSESVQRNGQFSVAIFTHQRSGGVIY